MTVERTQGFHDEALIDYRQSPHLAQWPLFDRVAGFVVETVQGLPSTGAPPRVLELGAGHGGYVELLLALGCEVTVVDMSRPAVQRLDARLGEQDRVIALHDQDMSLRDAGDGHSLALCVSLLHHVPDYLECLRRVASRLLPGGALVTVQDPLWYPRAGRVTRTVDRSAYLAWRIGQGNVRQGVEAMIRRLRRAYPDPRPGEIGYHHVVREGVDEQAVAELLEVRFARVELVSYWSHHLAAVRRPAERAGLVNTFAARGTGRRADN